jgi:hypothetical protein
MNWYKKAQSVGENIQFMWMGSPRQGVIHQAEPNGNVIVITRMDEPDMMGRMLRVQRKDIVDSQGTGQAVPTQEAIAKGSEIEFDWGGPVRATVKSILPNNRLLVQVVSTGKEVYIGREQARQV